MRVNRGLAAATVVAGGGLALAGSAALGPDGGERSRRDPPAALTKADSAGRLALGGGDTCATATLIPGLPFSDSGNTCGFADDYDEICPFNTPGAPDVVYAYAPPVDRTVDISLCGNSAYDTKLYVYEDVCGPYQSGVFIACNDDSCSTPSFPDAYVSEVLGVELFAGHTYYIVIDGYNGECGDYTLDVVGDEPPPPCPPESLFGQSPHGPSDAWSFGNADMDSNGTSYLRYDSFGGVTEPICGVAWYGIRAYVDPSLGWVECIEEPMTFEIVFYVDAGGAPGSAVCTYMLTVAAEPLGILYQSAFELLRWVADLEPCCALAEGWISIQALPGEPGCWFLWGSSGEGDGTSLVDDGSGIDTYLYDQSFCLLGPSGIQCPPGAFVEAEPCGADTNGGCNSIPPVFVPAACGQVFCGTAWADADVRDTDWFLVEHGGGILGASLVSEFPGVCFVVDGIDGCSPIVVGEIGCSDGGVPIAPAVAELPPGVYAIFVAPGTCDGGGILNGYPCGPDSDYIVEIFCEQPDIGACCLPNGECIMTVAEECFMLEGVFVGPGVPCADVICPPPGACPAPGGCYFAHEGTGCDDYGCCTFICVIDPFCCDVVWDGLCAEEANELCGFEPCPGPGDCFVPHGALGCDFPSCCNTVCAFDPFCCESGWDAACAAEADVVCTCPCDFDNDYDVDVDDLLVVLAFWCPGPACGPVGDCNGDGTTNVDDLLGVLAQWGPCP